MRKFETENMEVLATEGYKPTIEFYQRGCDSFFVEYNSEKDALGIHGCDRECSLEFMKEVLNFMKVVYGK